MTPDEVAELIVAELYRARFDASNPEDQSVPEDWMTDDRITIGDWKAAIVAVLNRLT